MHLLGLIFVPTQIADTCANAGTANCLTHTPNPHSLPWASTCQRRAGQVLVCRARMTWRSMCAQQHAAATHSQVSTLTPLWAMLLGGRCWWQDSEGGMQRSSSVCGLQGKPPKFCRPVLGAWPLRPPARCPGVVLMHACWCRGFVLELASPEVELCIVLSYLPGCLTLCCCGVVCMLCLQEPAAWAPAPLTAVWCPARTSACGVWMACVSLTHQWCRTSQADRQALSHSCWQSALQVCGC